MDGQIRIAQQFVGSRVATGAERDADARGELHAVTADLERHFQRLMRALRDGDDLGWIDGQRQDGELVAADAREHVAEADATEQAPAGEREQLITDAVPEPVVHVREAVEVNHQHAESDHVAAGDAGDRTHDAVAEIRAIRQRRQAVMRRLVLHLFFGALALFDLGGEAPVRLDDPARAQIDLALEHVRTPQQVVDEERKDETRDENDCNPSRLLAAHAPAGAAYDFQRPPSLRHRERCSDGVVELER